MIDSDLLQLVNTHPHQTAVIIGGGAAGIFAAIQVKEKNPSLHVIVLEKSAVFLSKVRISGGGRCNVTHSCFDPQQLVKFYPRGFKELLGPFHTFQPKDTISWYEERGALLKVEKDGRMFPTTNQSQTIINTLMQEVSRLGIHLVGCEPATAISKEEDLFHIQLKNERLLLCRSIMLATGSSSQGLLLAESLGHSSEKSVPSLFTFNLPSASLLHLSGVSVPHARVSLPHMKQSYEGPLLITHFGLSGPAVLKLSAWSAKELYAAEYKTEVRVNWAPHLTLEEVKEDLFKWKKKKPSTKVELLALYDLPKSLWKHLTQPWEGKILSHLSLKDMELLSQRVCQDTYQMEGKTTHKEEFVTCGGVKLNEVNFKTMESKKTPGLFFGGEVLNIDGITGGFNFQNAWTTGYIAGLSMACSVREKSLGE
ncbi:MAG: aminoacetone oxidase family FAD-binding enzyme [Candidatus Rhabdochlamydia sp.]